MGQETRVLIVEDNAATRSLLEQTLELEGYAVSSVADGNSAMQHILLSRPSLVLLDAMIPGIDGFEVLKRIRSDERTRDLPVLMLTAMDDADSTWRGWSTGCDYYMNKPFDTDDLLMAVQRLAMGGATV